MLLVKQIFSGAPTTRGMAAASAMISGMTVQTIRAMLDEVIVAVMWPQSKKIVFQLLEVFA